MNGEIKRGALHFAAAKGDVKTVIDLVSKGALVDELDYDKRTPLHAAAANGHLSTMEALVTRGANIKALNRWGRTPLEEALNGNHQDAVAYLEKRGAGAKGPAAMFKKQVSFQTIDPTSFLAVLFSAIVDNDLMTVKDLVGSKKVKVDDADDDKRTACHLAASEGKLEILTYLIAQGANVNAKDRMGNRPLNDAIRGNHEACSNLLAAEGGIATGGGQTDMDPSQSASPKMYHWRHVSKEALNELHQRGVREFWSWDREDFEMEKEPFGKGAGGEVYKARFREMEVVAKTLGKISVEHDTLTDLANEISLMASIRHPYIVSFYGACFQVSPPIMLIEYCSKGNLESRIISAYDPEASRSARLSGSQKLKYMHQITLAMTFLHKFHIPITHRDLKPGNILLTQNDDIKITDFGLAKFTPKRQDTTDTYKMTGETGSYRFMAPEVFEHRPYDQKVDVYAFAMIIYWLYSGTRPFVTCRDGVDAVKQAVKKVRPPITKVKEDKVAALIQRCWDHDAANRPDFAVIARQCEEMKTGGVGRRISTRILNFLGVGSNGATTEETTDTTNFSLSPRSTEESGSEGNTPARKGTLIGNMFKFS